MTTAFVVRKNGKFAKGQHRWTTEWVEDINKARVFNRRADAANSIVVQRDHGEIIPVHIVPVDQLPEAK